MPDTEASSASWQGVPTEALAERWSAGAVHAFARVGSTSDVARRLAEQGAPRGTVVVADEQVLGRGRAGRGWASAPGLGLWTSLVLRPGEGANPMLLPLMIGLAAARAMESLGGSGRVGIKWPNDLLIDGRKVGGVLCEAVWKGDSVAFVIAGIGINVRHEVSDFPAEIAPAATSLRLAGAEAVTVLTVADAIVPAVVGAVAGSEYVALPADVHAELNSRHVLAGRHVVVTDPITAAEVARGRVSEISTDGSLTLQVDSGNTLSLRSGTVRALDDYATKR